MIQEDVISFSRLFIGVIRTEPTRDVREKGLSPSP